MALDALPLGAVLWVYVFSTGIADQVAMNAPDRQPGAWPMSYRIGAVVAVACVVIPLAIAGTVWLLRDPPWRDRGGMTAVYHRPTAACEALLERVDPRDLILAEQDVRRDVRELASRFRDDLTVTAVEAAACGAVPVIVAFATHLDAEIPAFGAHGTPVVAFFAPITTQ